MLVNVFLEKKKIILQILSWYWGFNPKVLNHRATFLVHFIFSDRVSVSCLSPH